jgi:hypothetical protein
MYVCIDHEQINRSADVEDRKSVPNLFFRLAFGLDLLDAPNIQRFQRKNAKERHLVEKKRNRETPAQQRNSYAAKSE